MGKRGFLFVVAAAVCLAAPLASCLDATEIVIQLSTDVACDTVNTTQVVVRVGSPSNIATNPTREVLSMACTSGDATSATSNDLGNIVILPSGGFDDVVSITVALSNDGITPTPTSACFPEPQGASCIYAHRQITFLPHARVTLPIVLSSVCAGVQCKAPLTCNPDNGLCENGNIDPHDSGPIPDVTVDNPIIVTDAPVDSLPDVIPCSGGMVTCNAQCVDLQTNASNCGGCGVDCSGTGATCSGGTCTLNASLTGTCLAVVNGTVYVATGTGVYTVPYQGGAASLYGTTNDVVDAMGSTQKDVAWIAHSLITTPYLYDLGTKNTLSVANDAKDVSLMTINSNGAAWFDAATSSVYYQQWTSSAPLPYETLNTTVNPIPIAMGPNRVYYSVPKLNELHYADGSITKSVSVTSPGAIVVDDPNSVTNVYDVEGGTTVVKRDDLLANPTTFATTGVAITALAWDGKTLVANHASQISIAQAGSFVKLTAATPAQKCIAVDSNAVYWLGYSKGLFKHYKP